MVWSRRIETLDPAPIIVNIKSKQFSTVSQSGIDAKEKERCISTCINNGLLFIEDETNFQPALTLRNQVREYLARRSEGAGPAGAEEQEIEGAIAKLIASTPGKGNISHLREAVRQKGYDLDVVEARGTCIAYIYTFFFTTD